MVELQDTLSPMGTSTDPLRREARRLIDQGNVASGRAKLDEALDADEKAFAEAERVAAERRKAAAQSARDLGVLARGTDVLKAVAYFKRATRLDPSDAQTWHDYARAAMDAGSTDEAKTAFAQAVARAGEANDPRQRYWAMLGLGDIALTQGSLPEALRHYQAAAAVAETIAKADPGNAGWQRDLALGHGRVGVVRARQGANSEAALLFEHGRTIIARLRQGSPDNANLSRDLAWFEAQLAALKNVSN